MPKAQTKNQPGSRYVRNFCFLCGPDNPQGMRLKFSVDPVHSVVRGTFHLAHRYGGPASLAHDGIVAAVVEEAMAKLNSLDKLAVRIAEMTVEYLHPVPLGRKITVEARSSDPKGREFSRECTIRDSRGRVLVRGQGRFVRVGGKGASPHFD